MKATFVQDGKIIDYTASTDIAYGDVVAIGKRVGVAAESIKSGATGGVRLEGVYEMPTAAEAIALGDKLYFDVSNNCVTKTVGSLTVVAGIAVEEKTTSTAGTIACLI